MPRDENMIAALKRERAGYVARGLDDRVAEVDEQLEHYGYKPAASAEPAETTDAGGAPAGRTTPAEAKQTTADPKPKQQAAQKPTAAPKPPAQKPAGGKA